MTNLPASYRRALGMLADSPDGVSVALLLARGLTFDPPEGPAADRAATGLKTVEKMAPLCARGQVMGETVPSGTMEGVTDRQLPMVARMPHLITQFDLRNIGGVEAQRRD